MRKLIFNCRRLGPLFLVLATSAAVNIALFLVIDRVYLAPLPYVDASQIVHLEAPVSKWLRDPARFTEMSAKMTQAPLEQRAFVKERAVFEVGSPAETEMDLRAVFVSPEFFTLLGTRPVLGRPLEAADAVVKPRPIVISHDVWQRVFGGDVKILESTVTIPGSLEEPSWTIVGVMPEGFRFQTANLWIPFNPNEFFPSLGPDFARLRAGTSIDGVRSLLPGVTIEPLRAFLRPANAAVLGIIGFGSLLLFLLAFTQVAVLLHSRIATRIDEFKIRMAMGAMPHHVLGVAMREGLLVCSLGTGLAAVLVPLVSFGLFTLLPPDFDVASGTRFGIRGAFICVALLLLALLAWTFSSLYVVRAAWSRGNVGLGARVESSRSIVRVRIGLLVAQIAITATITVLALGTIRAFQLTSRLTLGFEPNGLIALHLPPPTAPRDTPPEARRALSARFNQIGSEVLAAVRQHPSVRSAAFASAPPLARVYERTYITLDLAGNQPLEIINQRVGLGYAATIGARLVAGREPTPDEARPRVEAGVIRQSAVVNATLANALATTQSMVGRVISQSSASTVTVTGVVSDIEDDVVDGKVQATMYRYMPPGSYAPMLLVRLDKPEAANGVEAVVQSIWGDNRRSRTVVRVNETVQRATADYRGRAAILAAIGSLCIALMVVGVLGTVRFMVITARRELAIRLALGASRQGLAAWLLRRTILPVSIGIIAGIGAGAFASLAARSLDGAMVIDPISVGSAVCLALAAAAIPVWRATRSISEVGLAELLRDQ